MLGEAGNGLLRSLRAQLYWEPTPQSATSLAVQLGAEPCPVGIKQCLRGKTGGVCEGADSLPPERVGGRDPGSEQEVSWDKTQRAVARQN